MSAIVPRDLDVDFSEVPRHWLRGNAVATAVANGINVLFPWGERFFVRSVNHYVDEIDPELRAQVRAFFGQEGRHARAHDQFNAVMRAQGYDLDAFFATYQKVSARIEATSSPALRLAVTAAAEHFTAIMAEGAFGDEMLDLADPRMRELLAWHAAEELEHKSVAFDVLQRVNPSYALRVAGLALATVLLAGFWTWATAVLLKQDGFTLREARRELRALRKKDPIMKRVFLRGIRSYLRRDFHPEQHDTTQLAAAWMSARGMQMPEAA